MFIIDGSLSCFCCLCHFVMIFIILWEVMLYSKWTLLQVNMWKKSKVYKNKSRQGYIWNHQVNLPHFPNTDYCICMSLVFPFACHSFPWLYFTIQSQCHSPSAVAVNSVIKRNQMQTVLEIHYHVLQKLNELSLRVNLCKGQVCWHFLVEEKTMSKYNHCTFYFIVYFFGSSVERMDQKWCSKTIFLFNCSTA